MQLNPKTAAKQWLRRTKKKYPKMNPELFTGKNKILSLHAANTIAYEAHLKAEEEKKKLQFV